MKKLSILPGFVLTTFITDAQQKINNEEIMAKVSKGKPFTLVLLKAGKEASTDEKEMQSLQMEHLSNLFSLEQKGKISVFGPFTNDKALRGMIVFNTTNKEEIIKELEVDPYIQSGYMKYELYDWFSIPGQKIPE